MNNILDPSQLLLEQFRKIAYAAPKQYRWIVVWILLYVEPIYIKYVMRDTVDNAVQEYHKHMDALELPSYIIESKPSEVKGLDELRIYYRDQTTTTEHRDTTQE